MHLVSRCTGRLGLRHQCTKQAFHDGDHENGDRTWPRTAKELATIERHECEMRKLRERVTRLRADDGQP